MLAAICFDNQTGRWAGEIGDITANRKLAAEFPTGEPLRPQQFPQPLFGVGLVFAKRADAIFESPSPQPLSHKGRGAIGCLMPHHAPITLDRPSSPIATKVKVAWVTRSISSPARMRRQAETSIFIEERPTETTSA